MTVRETISYHQARDAAANHDVVILWKQLSADVVGVNVQVAPTAAAREESGDKETDEDNIAHPDRLMIKIVAYQLRCEVYIAAWIRRREVT